MPDQLSEWAVPVRVHATGMVYVRPENAADAMERVQRVFVQAVSVEINGLISSDWDLPRILLHGTPEKIA